VKKLITDQGGSMETVVSRDGTSIAFDRTGQGPPVILVGGAFQHRAIDLTAARLAGLLGPRLTVFHYDRRGRGDSGDTAPYAVEREIEDLEALIAAAGGSARLVGISSGGALALEAARHGLAVVSLAVFEPPFIVDDGRPIPPSGLGERYAALAAAGRRGEAVELFLRHAAGLPGGAVAQLRGAPVWPALESVAHTLAYDTAIMGETLNGSADPLGRWASVGIPALVIDGGASPQWARNGARALAAILPNAVHHTIEGETHQVSADALAPVLDAFFAGRSVASMEGVTS
jgi:pimeloyl-ACP methyl ester carboxylesterase